MSPKGKSGLLLAIGGPKGDSEPPPSEPDIQDDEGGDGSDEDEAIDMFFDAVKEGDREGAREAFKTAVEACMGSYGGRKG